VTVNIVYESLNLNPINNIPGKSLIPVISPKSFFESRNQSEFILIDVREPEEFEYTQIAGSILVPLGELESKIPELYELYSESKIVLICRSGQRSAFATKLMREKGFSDVSNLEGGILEYSSYDNSLKRY